MYPYPSITKPSSLLSGQLFQLIELQASQGTFLGPSDQPRQPLNVASHSHRRTISQRPPFDSES